MITQQHTNPDGSVVSIYIGKGASIDKYARVDKHVSIGDGASIGKGVSIDKGVRIGDVVRIGEGAIIGKHVSIGTNADIGEGASIGKNINIGWGVSIGEYVHIGDGVSIGEGARIDKHTTIGAYACIPANTDWILNLGADNRGTIHACRVAGVLRITAGHFDFTAEEALTHWANNKHLTLAIRMAMAMELVLRIEHE